ncbi:MAG TPA: DNA-3-methyladenine glycosylase I [Motilibacterales bacterium]|nr:DNA-3-methyladenine glycosylase I [Motilibacterales bacterium]
MGEPLLDASAPRCFWVDSAPAEYLAYHDTEWGYPVADERRLFEKLCLEGFQSGLSWLTILRKRQNFRAAFAEFDIEAVARFTVEDVSRLLGDAGIVRHRGKIEATIGNARAALDLVESQGSLAAYLWGFEPAPEDRPTHYGAEDVRALTTAPAAVALSKDLKRRGFRFVGPTTIYAFMQAMGLVNDHTEDCVCRALAQAARRGFTVPTSPASGAP